MTTTIVPTFAMPPERQPIPPPPASAMADEHPILRSLLDSLNAMNERLNVIENVLTVPDPTQQSQQQQQQQQQQSATAIPKTIGEGHAHAQVQQHPSNVNSRRPLPSTAQQQQPPPQTQTQLPPLQQPLPSASQFATATTPSSTVPSPTSYHHIPPANAPIPYSPYDAEPPKPSPSSASSSKRSSQPSRAPLNTRVKFEDDNSDEDLEGNNDSRLAGKDDDEEDDEDDDDDDDDGQQGSRHGEAGGSSSGSATGTLPKELQPTGVGESRLEALPEGFVVSGRATLQEELDGWTIPRGYSMRINGTRSHGRRQKIRMVCFRGGRSRLRPKEEEAKREREKQRLLLFPDLPPRRRKPTTDRISKKCECPFRFELVEVCPGADRYAVHYTNDDHTQHNHAAADLMLDPRARKLPRALKAEVDQWLRDASTLGTGGNSKSGGDAATASGSASGGASGSGGSSGPGWTIAKIQAELQRRGYGHVLDFDLRNRKRALLHKDRMAQLKQEGAGGGGESSTGGDTTAAAS